MANKLVGVVLDSGALILADKNDRRFWIFWKKVVQQGLDLVVPATVLAQAWRGSKNVKMALVLKSCSVDPLSEKSARSIGEFCGGSKSKDIVDASVVLTASGKRYAVLTSDSSDLVPLAKFLDKPPLILDLSTLES